MNSIFPNRRNSLFCQNFFNELDIPREARCSGARTIHARGVQSPEGEISQVLLDPSASPHRDLRGFPLKGTVESLAQPCDLSGGVVPRFSRDSDGRLRTGRGWVVQAMSLIAGAARFPSELVARFLA